MRAPTSEPVNAIDGRVAEELVGEAWPSAHPGEDATLYGHVALEPRDPVEVRSLQTFRLRYTVGRYGLDDTGAIKVAFRAMGDGDALQTSDPTAPNYVTATSSCGVPLKVEYRSRGMAPRPRWKALTVIVGGGYLSEGDVITVVFGDTSHGSPGMRMQTMAEAAFEFKVLADVCAVGHFYPVPNTPTVDIVPGDPVQWKAVLPSLRRPGERFRFGVKAEDRWGNPTGRASARLRFEPSRPVDGLPAEFDYPLGRKSVAFDGLSVAEPGVVRIRVLDEEGAVLAESHPLVVREGPFGGYWGDMHGQSGESIGITTARQYFDFARNKSFLDATGHQANDFQVNNAFWAYLQTLTAEYDEDGVFVTLPGYEWSGNTAVGGDRNVYYRTEGRPIFRSSHALLPDRSDLHTDATNANLLFERLAGEDCVAYAHVGGRYADTAYAHDGRIETAMEIHSAWGTFEWLLTDGFALGHRCGVVCNSDGHKGRPGASYPGAATFGAYGGLTCFYAEELSRDGLFECLRKRHHFGTTGTRMHLDVRASFAGGGDLFDCDPKVFDDATSTRVGEVMMGRHRPHRRQARHVAHRGDHAGAHRTYRDPQRARRRAHAAALRRIGTRRPHPRALERCGVPGARAHHLVEGPGAVPRYPAFARCERSTSGTTNARWRNNRPTPCASTPSPPETSAGSTRGWSRAPQAASSSRATMAPWRWPSRTSGSTTW